MKTETIRIRIERDCSEHDTPRDWENQGTMVCWHRNYNLGDEQPTVDSDDFLRELAAETVNAYDADLIPDEHVERIIEKYFVIIPLYLYDHSGITMSCAPFSCPWDSGQVGYIYCSIEKARECFLLDDSAGWNTVVKYADESITLREATERNLRCEVKVYDQYLTGDVYGLVIEDDDGEHIDSCWGFYGDDPFKNGMSDCIDEKYHEALREAETQY